MRSPGRSSTPALRPSAAAPPSPPHLSVRTFASLPIPSYFTDFPLIELLVFANFDLAVVIELLGTPRGLEFRL